MKIWSSMYGLAREAGGVSADAFAVRAWDQTLIAVLSDGAGTGLPAREAGQRAVASLVDHYVVRPRIWSPERALVEFTELLNRALYQESQVRYERSEMVATLAVVVVEGDLLYGLNVGDSRVLLWRAGALQQLSVDHADKVQTNLLTRALGLAAEVEPHCFRMPLLDGDVVLLCSDGVSNLLSADALEAALGERANAQAVVELARAGAREEMVDDASAVVLHIERTGKLRAMNQRSLSIPLNLSKGDLLDGYELVRSFQGTDRVWLAEKEGVRVVLKFAPREAASSEQYLDAFTKETWNATRVQSGHFVRSTEPFGQSMRYYVMEFVDAPNLQVVLNERTLSVDSAVGLGRFLAQASQMLLGMGLAHGDVKPENILCVGDYAKLMFKLVDLGSAAELFSVVSRAGTASYLAPERFHGAPISERTELFAMGVTLYQALTGKMPYGEIERFQVPAFSWAKRVSRLNPNVPPWLDAVIARAICIDAEQRYQHYSEMLFDLENPTLVPPFLDRGVSWLERNPLGFYKVGFFVFLALSIWLALLLAKR
jgi:serine/threonine protein phosphatase PrpC